MSDNGVLAGMTVGALFGTAGSIVMIISPMEDRCRQREVDRCLKTHIENVPAFRVCESKAKEWCSR